MVRARIMHQAHLSKSHSFTVLSPLAVARWFPSGWKAMLAIHAECAWPSTSVSPLSRSDGQRATST